MACYHTIPFNRKENSTSHLASDYVEEGFVKGLRVRVRPLEGLGLEEMAGVLRATGYLVQAPW